jgi:cytochrome P450
MLTSHPPGPKTLSPLGVVRDFQRDPLQFTMQMKQQYGDFVALPTLFFLHTYLINDPNLIHQVLVKKADQFRKPRPLNNVLRSTFGNGLFFSEGDFWRRQRRLMQPTFHHQHIGAYASRMVALTTQLLDTWREGETRQIDEDMRALTLQVVVDAVFHGDISEEIERVGWVMSEAAQVLTEQTYNPLKAILPDWLPLAFLRRKRRAVAVLDEIIYRFIAERRLSGREESDLISLLMQVEDDETGERMSDLQVHDEVATLLIAGHETSSLALTWAWFLLARHPEAAAALYAEVDEVLKGKPAELADLPRLPYAEMVIKEVLRLYPPSWMILREAVEDTALGDYQIRNKDILMMAPYVVQRDARFYDDPDSFQPERFAPDDSGRLLEKRLPKLAYFPFGSGPRICLGNGFAMLEMQLVLATIAQRYRLFLVSDQSVEPAARLTLSFSGSIPMRVVARRDSAS